MILSDTNLQRISGTGEANGVVLFVQLEWTTSTSPFSRVDDSPLLASLTRSKSGRRSLDFKVVFL
jgi:hypothetical protein